MSSWNITQWFCDNQWRRTCWDRSINFVSVTWTIESQTSQLKGYFSNNGIVYSDILITVAIPQFIWILYVIQSQSWQKRFGTCQLIWIFYPTHTIIAIWWTIQITQPSLWRQKVDQKHKNEAVFAGLLHKHAQLHAWVIWMVHHMEVIVWVG